MGEKHYRNDLLDCEAKGILVGETGPPSAPPGGSETVRKNGSSALMVLEKAADLGRRVPLTKTSLFQMPVPHSIYR